MNEQETRTLIDRLRFPSSEAELSAAAGEAADDREWFNQRLANARLHNSDLEQRIAQIKSVAFNTRHTHVERIRQIRALLESRLSPTAKS
jgi:uncharacterized protein YfiM (DUF2279 family)